jgi:hypothetical protein
VNVAGAKWEATLRVEDLAYRWSEHFNPARPCCLMSREELLSACAPFFSWCASNGIEPLEITSEQVRQYERKTRAETPDDEHTMMMVAHLYWDLRFAKELESGPS